MKDAIEIKFEYRGAIPFRSISDSILCIEEALQYANERLLKRLSDKYSSSNIEYPQYDELEKQFREYYKPKILIETAFLGSWGLKGKVATGVFAALFFFSVSGTASYEAIREESQQQVDEFAFDICEFINESKDGLQNFSVGVYETLDGVCVEFREALSERIIDNEEIFRIKYVLRLEGYENDPADVRSLRWVLNELGYELDISEDFNIVLEMAVRKFQRAEGIVPDGEVGEITVNALKTAVYRAINTP